MGYNLNIMQKTACWVFNPIRVNSYAFLFNCRTVDRVSGPIKVSTKPFIRRSMHDVICFFSGPPWFYEKFSSTLIASACDHSSLFHQSFWISFTRFKSCFTDRIREPLYEPNNRFALRKHAYWKILKISPPKTETFKKKKLIVFILMPKT